MISKKLMKEILQITDVDENVMQQKRVLWQVAASQRNDYLKELRVEGLKGKEYSDAVVAYDKQHQQVFYV